MIICMVGLPGAGKSVLAKALADALGFVHIEGDRVRAEMMGTKTDPYAHDPEHYTPDKVEAVRIRVLETVERLATDGKNVVVDDCFHTRAERRRMRKLAKKLTCSCVFLYIAIDAEVACRRAGYRATIDPTHRGVTRGVVDKHIRSFNAPQGVDVITIDGNNENPHQRLEDAIFAIKAWWKIYGFPREAAPFGGA